MKLKLIFSMMIALLLSLGCGASDSGVLPLTDADRMPSIKASVTGGTPSFSTPVIFVHGIDSIGGDTFYNIMEKFEAYGYPASMLSMPLLPRIGIGELNVNYAWYTAVSSYNYNADHWLGDASHWHGYYYNEQELMNHIANVMQVTNSSKVDLVGHSNGTCVIRKMLARHKTYFSDKVRKVVFISGFADVSAADGLDNIASDLNAVSPIADLPLEDSSNTKIEYYALSSESDANADNMDVLLGTPENENPAPFDGTGRFWLMDDENNEDGLEETNWNIVGQDHMGVTTCDETINKVFEWLTGVAPGDLPTLSTVTIGGRIVQSGSVDSYEEFGNAVEAYEQKLAPSAEVSINYYDPATGAETGTWSNPVDLVDGRYTISNVSTAQYVKMKVQAVGIDPGNVATNIYFFANKITQNNNALDFNAPVWNTSYVKKGYVSIRIACRYSYLSYYGYAERPNDQFSGEIKSGAETVTLGNTCLNRLAPMYYPSIYLKNFGYSTIFTGGNEYKFSSTNYGSNNVTVTSDLQNTGSKTKIIINGEDRFNHIENFIVYLYR